MKHYTVALKVLIYVSVTWFILTDTIHLQTQEFNPLPEYNEERQLRIIVQERSDIPDGMGGMLVYDSGSINLVDLSTKQHIRYAGLPLMYNPTLSIGTGQLVFGRDHVYLLDIHTGMVRRISPEGQSDNPTISPDGRYVVYTHRNTIRVVDLILNELRTLELNVPANVTSLGSLRELRWSPDGQQIIMLGQPEYQAPHQVYLIPTSCLQEEACNLEIVAEQVDNPRSMIWHPNSQMLGFVDHQLDLRELSQDAREWNFRFYTATLDETVIDLINNLDFDVYSPSWSPDGSQLIFALENNSHDGEVNFEEGLYRVDVTNPSELEYLFPISGSWNMRWHDTSFAELGIDFDTFQQSASD